jgi:hypothetical protein
MHIGAMRLCSALTGIMNSAESARIIAIPATASTETNAVQSAMEFSLDFVRVRSEYSPGEPD